MSPFPAAQTTCSGRQNWIKVKLEGVKSNRSAIGAASFGPLWRQSTAQGVLSQSELLFVQRSRLHFGWARPASDIEIFWPNVGMKDITKSLPVNW